LHVRCHFLESPQHWIAQQGDYAYELNIINGPGDVREFKKDNSEHEEMVISDGQKGHNDDLKTE
jgi:hypothetical protein